MLDTSSVAFGAAASLHVTGNDRRLDPHGSAGGSGLHLRPGRGDFAYDGTGAVGAYQVSVTETKGDATKTTVFTLTILAAGTFIPSLDFSDARNSQNL